MKQKLLHLLFLFPFLMGFVGNVQAQEALSVTEITAQIQQAALTTAMTTSFQSSGTTWATDLLGNTIQITAGEVSIDEMGPQTQVITVVTRDENDNILSVVEKTTTVEASQTNGPGARATQVEVARDPSGLQIGEAQFTVTDYYYTFTINGKTYNTVAELLAALSVQSNGDQVNVTVCLYGSSSVNGVGSSIKTSYTYNQYLKGSSNSIEIPTTLETTDESSIAISTQRIDITTEKTFTLTIKVVDTDGAPVIDDRVYVMINNNSIGYLSEINTVTGSIKEGETVIIQCAVGNYYGNYVLTEQTITATNDETITLTIPKEIRLTIKVVETDGTPVIDGGVYVMINNNFIGNLSESNTITGSVKEGETVIIQCAVGDYYYGKYVLTEQTITATSDETITLTIPKEISFSIILNNKEVTYAKILGLDWQYAGVNNDYTGTYTGRLDPNNEYRVNFQNANNEYYKDKNYVDVEGSTKITDGMTIRIGKLTVQTEGAGLAFPFAPFGTTSSYYVFVGNSVRLAAVPVGDSKFQCWSINGKEYTDALMDFEVKDDITVATAKFTEKVATRIQSLDNNVKPINVTIEGNYLVLPAEVEASAGIYAVDGRQVKRTGVVGHRINISDLPAGAYVLTLTADGLRQSAQFVK